MATDFLPARDGALLNWSANFSSQISATPTAFGLTAPQATAYAALHATFASAYASAIDPATRTRATIVAKDDARQPLKTMARELARIVQAYPPLTNEQRVLLGLKVRDVEPSPINPPTESPVLEVVSASGRTLLIKLRSVDSDRRGKPEGVDGATLFSYVGATPPADINAWTYEGQTSRTKFDMNFPPTVPAGAQIWLTAFWYNPRKQAGPACQPVTAFLAGGVGVSLAA